MASLTQPEVYFTKAIQSEVWEDVDEAQNQYTRFLEVYKEVCKSIQYRSELERACRAILLVEMRVSGLQDTMGLSKVEVKDMKRLRSHVTQTNGMSDGVVGDQDSVLFPSELFSTDSSMNMLEEMYQQLSQGVIAGEASRAAEAVEFAKRQEEEKAAQKKLQGLTLCVERIGEKRIAMFHETIYYERPFVRIHLYSNDGATVIEPCRETRGGSRDKELEQHIVFMQDICFQTELTTCRMSKLVCYLEFLSRNKIKGRDETICWTCLEMDEIPDEGAPLLLEWYKTPMDVTRKNIRLHTIKELYCHVVCGSAKFVFNKGQ